MGHTLTSCASGAVASGRPMATAMSRRAKGILRGTALPSRVAWPVARFRREKFLLPMAVTSIRKASLRLAAPLA